MFFSAFIPSIYDKNRSKCTKWKITGNFVCRTEALAFIDLTIFLCSQETQIRITPPPPYNHQNSQDNQIISNSNLMQSSKPNSDNSQGQNITNLPNISNSGSSTSNNSRRSINRVGGNTSLTVKNAVMRYNRRNNPELEKRRIHHCDFLGIQSFCTIQSIAFGLSKN